MKHNKKNEPDFYSSQYDHSNSYTPRHAKKTQKTNENRKGNSNRNKRKKSRGSSVLLWIYRLLALVAIGVFCYAAWHLYVIWNQDHQIKQENDELKQYLQVNSQQNEDKEEFFSVDWAGIQATNPNVVAWIAVPGTDISYAVVQGEDNSFYLDHSLQGSYNSMGSIFLDSAANPQFLDDNSIVYGHSVSDIGGMFTSLEKFNDSEFFNNHPYFWLLTPSQNYRVNAYAYYQGDDESMIYTTDFGDYQSEVLAQIASECKYVREDVNTAEKRFISLSTCDLTYGFNSNQRYVLMGALEEWNELIPLSEVQ